MQSDFATTSDSPPRAAPEERLSVLRKERFRRVRGEQDLGSGEVTIDINANFRPRWLLDSSIGLPSIIIDQTQRGLILSNLILLE